MEVRKNLNRNDRISLFHCIQELKGKEEVLDYFLDYLSTEEDPTLLIYAVWCTEGGRGPAAAGALCKTAGQV